MYKIAISKPDNDFLDLFGLYLKKSGFSLFDSSDINTDEKKGLLLQTVDFKSQHNVDLLIMTPRENLSTVSGASETIKCKAAVIYGCDASELSSKINPGRIITYGLAARDTVTMSSMMEGIGVISIQREIIDINDKTVEIQEFKMPIQRSVDINNILAIISGLILLGVDVKKLQDIFN